MNTQSNTFKVRLGIFVFVGIVLFFLAQKAFVEGVTLTGVKG